MQSAIQSLSSSSAILTFDEKLRKGMEELFASVDDNGDGVITETELYQAIRATADDGVDLAEVRRIMVGLDKDKDGFIDSAEFAAFMAEQIRGGAMTANDPMLDIIAEFSRRDVERKGWLRAQEASY